MARRCVKVLGGEGTVLWRRLERLEVEVEELARNLGIMEGELRALKKASRARLKEEADMRERTLPFE